MKIRRVNPSLKKIQILEKCSPFDLVQLGLTSRFLRSFIAAHGHLWTAAQSNIVHLPPPPAVEASGNYSQSAYAVWLFAGGPCTVREFIFRRIICSRSQVCSESTVSQPFHFLFRFRACSVGQACAPCQDPTFLTCSTTRRRARDFCLRRFQPNFTLPHIHSSSNASVFVDENRKYENFSWGKWLPRVERVLPGGVLTHAYSTLAIQNADRERQQAIGVDRGNSRRDPRGFPCRTSQHLDAVRALCAS